MEGYNASWKGRVLHHLRRLISGLSFLLGLFGLVSGAAVAQGGGPVLLAPVTGIINPVQAGYIDRVINQAEQNGAAAVVLEIDTPGGLDTSMRQIVQRILSSRVPVIVYVSPPGGRAGSAGVYIAYAAHVSAMAPNTNIGSATPVTLGGGAEVKPSDEMRAKTVNDAAAYIRSLAEQRGRNADWAERAVREGINATASEAVQQGIVEHSAPDLRQLLQQVDGQTVETARGPTVLRTADAPVERVEMNAFERLLHVISDPTIAYLLLSLGSLGLMLELYNPGQVLPGVVGGLCLLLALYSLGTLPVNYAGLLLLGFAFLLFIADVLSPTHGILTVGGAIAFILGSFLLFNTPESAPFLRVSIPVILGVAALLVGFSVFAVGAVARSRRRKVVTGREGLVGELAEVRTRLDPSGLVHLESELWRARTSGRAVEPGERVRVLAIDGLYLTVAPEVTEPETAAPRRRRATSQVATAERKGVRGKPAAAQEKSTSIERSAEPTPPPR
jgi:membrane-bound serine protease (ClpP class)